MRCLKNQLPNVSVHYLTKKGYIGLLENNPNIDKLYVIDKEITEIVQELRNENYDLIIDLHNNLRTRRLKIALRKKSYAFKKLNFKKYLLTKFKVNKLPNVHIVERYLETLKPLGVKNDGKGLDYFLMENDRVGDLPDEFIAVAVGAKFATKRMPEDLLLKVLQDSDKPIILLGGKEDRELGEKLNENLKNAKNFCGALSLGQSAFVLSKATTVLTGDTGLMHIASAFNKNIVSVWGNTVPEFGMYPYLPENDEICRPHEVKLSCRPCSKIGYDTCPKGHFNCMNQQNIIAIQEDLNKGF